MPLSMWRFDFEAQKKKWSALFRDIVAQLAEAESKIRREEILKQIQEHKAPSRAKSLESS